MVSPTNRIMQDIQPRVNDEVCEGLATSHLDGLHEYIHMVMLNAARDLFCPGLEYVGRRLCSPYEQMHKSATLPSRQNKIAVEESDVYMVRFDFKFNGKPIEPQYLMLPFTDRGGVLTIRGSDYVISPAIVDNVFSIEESNIFIPFTRSRDNFRGVIGRFYANGTLNETKCVWSQLYRDQDKSKLNKSWLPTLANYLFAYRGVTETFKRYCNTKVHFGTTEITSEKYPDKDWVIFESAGNRVENRSKLSRIFKTPARLAIRKSEIDKNRGVLPMVAGLFYTLDYASEFAFSHQIEQLDNPQFWKRILIRFIHKDVTHERKYMDMIDTHLESLNCYVDAIMKNKLAAQGILLEDTVDLFAYLNENYTILTSTCDPADTIGKVLEIRRFVSHSIISKIFKMGYDLKRLTENRLSEANIVKIMRMHLKPDTILGITSNHGIVSSVESATDCMLMKVTLPVVSQTRATGGQAQMKKETEMTQSGFQLHPSIMHAHSFLAIKKSAPSGRGLLNPFINIDRNYTVRPLEGLEEETKNLEFLLRKN